MKKPSFFYQLSFLSIVITTIASFLILSSCEKENDEVHTPEEEEIVDLPIEVGAIFPEKADLGDTLSLIGKNFSSDIDLIINEMKLDLISNNDSVVKFKVPYDGFDPSNFELMIDNQEENSELQILSNPFELYTPTIDSIPSNYGFEGQVVIYGKHLTNFPDQKTNIVYLNQENITVISHNKDSIVFELPRNLEKYEHDILIKAQLQEVQLIEGIKISHPKITGVSKNKVKVGEEITIYGSHFYPQVSDYNKFYIAGNRSEVVEAYKDSLIVKVSLGPYKKREIGNTRIEIFDVTVAGNLDLYLDSKWYLHSSKRDFELTDGLAGVGHLTYWSFYDNNTPYFNVYRNGNAVLNNVIYKYTPETDEWEESILPIPTEGMRFGEVFYLFPLNDGQHIYIYISRELNNFYKYNFITKDIVQLADFTNTELIKQPTGFIRNNNLYFGLGYTGSTQVSQNRNIWKYIETNNTWNQITEIPLVNDDGLRNAPSVFKRNGKFYIGNGEERTYDLWEYTPDNTWVRKSDVPNPVQYAINIQINERGFYYNNYQKNFWEYNIDTDQWSKRDDLIAEGYSLGHETMFIHGDFVYLVGYQNGYPQEHSGFSRYDHIILRTELSNFK